MYPSNGKQVEVLTLADTDGRTDALQQYRLKNCYRIGTYIILLLQAEYI